MLTVSILYSDKFQKIVLIWLFIANFSVLLRAMREKKGGEKFYIEFQKELERKFD